MVEIVLHAVYSDVVEAVSVLNREPMWLKYTGRVGAPICVGLGFSAQP